MRMNVSTACRTRGSGSAVSSRTLAASRRGACSTLWRNPRQFQGPRVHRLRMRRLHHPHRADVTQIGCASTGRSSTTTCTGWRSPTPKCSPRRLIATSRSTTRSDRTSPSARSRRPLDTWRSPTYSGLNVFSNLTRNTCRQVQIRESRLGMLLSGTCSEAWWLYERGLSRQGSSDDPRAEEGCPYFASLGGGLAFPPCHRPVNAKPRRAADLASERRAC